MLKLMIVGCRRSGMTLEEHHRYMADVHGAMVLRHIAASPGLTPQRYVQNHVFEGSRDFVTQVWFDSPAQAAASVQAPLYLNELQPDEDNFVDQTSVVKLPVIEQPLFDAARPAGRSKLFVFHRRAAGETPDALAEATLAHWQPLLADATLRIDRVLRNRVLARPGEEAAAADIVDEAWLADDAAARTVAARLAPGATIVLLAHERVLHAGA